MCIYVYLPEGFVVFWFLSIHRFSLVTMCSELSLQSVPSHLIILFSKFEFRFGFQDEGVNKPCRDQPGGQGPPGD